MSASHAPMTNAEKEELAAIARAEAELAAIKDNYLVSVSAEIEAVADHLDRIRRSAGRDAEALQAIFSVMHNIKGQGSTFGYMFVTELADIACTVLRDRTTTTPAELKVVDQCRSVIKITVERRMEGTGGDKGRDLLARLQAMAGDAIARRLVAGVG